MNGMMIVEEEGEEGEAAEEAEDEVAGDPEGAVVEEALARGGISKLSSNPIPLPKLTFPLFLARHPKQHIHRMSTQKQSQLQKIIINRARDVGIRPAVAEAHGQSRSNPAS
jgi:hypothetical protein